MATLYQAIQRFYLKDRFRFKLKHKNEMGTRLRELWKSMHPDRPTETVISEEDTGQYKVISYPDDFETIVDQLVRNYHKEILQLSKERRAREASQTAATAPIEIKRIRKRIPTKKIPAWKAK